MAGTILVMLAIWWVGWQVWGWACLWNLMVNTEYQTTLMVLMGLTLLSGVGLSIKKPILKLPKSKARAKAHDPVDLGPINKRVDELSEKVADMHSMMKFLKNVKEKNGGKT